MAPGRFPCARHSLGLFLAMAAGLSGCAASKSAQTVLQELFKASRWVALLSVVMIAVAPSTAVGSVILPVNLDETVALADVIFAGTVTRLDYASVDSAVFTKVTLRKLDKIKGGIPSDSIVIQVTGGIWKGDKYKTVGYPEFEVGGRYVLCVRNGLGTADDHYQPIVFWNQGFFPILDESSARKEVVHDCDYRPIIRIENRGLVVAEIPSRPIELRSRIEARARRFGQTAAPREYRLKGYGNRMARMVIPDQVDPGSRLREAEFIREVRRIANDRSAVGGRRDHP